MKTIQSSIFAIAIALMANVAVASEENPHAGVVSVPMKNNQVLMYALPKTEEGQALIDEAKALKESGVTQDSEEAKALQAKVEVYVGVRPAVAGQKAKAAEGVKLIGNGDDANKLADIAKKESKEQCFFGGYGFWRGGWGWGCGCINYAVAYVPVVRYYYGGFWGGCGFWY